MSPAPPAARVPWLAPDARRAWVALLATVPASLVAGFVIGFVLARTDRLDLVDRVQFDLFLGLMALFFLLYAVLTWWVFHRRDRAELEHLVPATTPRARWARVSLVLSGGGPTSWSSTAALFALGVVVYVAFTPAIRTTTSTLLVCVALVVTGWAVVAISFAVHYLRSDVSLGGLEFPGDEPPVFGDYLYLALQISTTYSSSDVSVTTRRMRRQVTRQTLIAFVFNSVIIALLVSALLLASPA